MYLVVAFSFLVFLMAINRLALYDNIRSRPVFYVTILALFYFLFLSVIGFRDFSAGNDTIRYVYAFEKLTDISSSREVGMVFFGNSELLFWPLAALLKSIVDDARFFLVATSTFSFFSSLWAFYSIGKNLLEMDKYRSLEIAAVSCVIAFSIYQLVYFGNHIRASVAIPIACVSLSLAGEKRLQSVLLMALAAGFHSSVLLLYPVLLYAMFGHYKIHTFFLIFIIGFIGASNIEYFYPLFSFLGLDMKVNLYVSEKVETQIESIFLMSSTWVILLLGAVSTLVTNERYRVITSLLIILVVALSVMPIVSVRYFPVLLLIAIPGVISVLDKYFGKRLSTIGLFFCICITNYVMLSSDSVKYTLGL